MLATVYFIGGNKNVYWLYLIVNSEEGKLKYIGSRRDNKHPVLYVKYIIQLSSGHYATVSAHYEDQDGNKLRIEVGDWEEHEFVIR